MPNLRETSPILSPVHFVPFLHKYVTSLAPLPLTLPTCVRPFYPRVVAKNRGRESRGEEGRRGRKGERERDSESTPYRHSRILHRTHGRRRCCRPGRSLGSVRCDCSDAAVAAVGCDAMSADGTLLCVRLIRKRWARGRFNRIQINCARSEGNFPNFVSCLFRPLPA